MLRLMGVSFVRRSVMWVIHRDKRDARTLLLEATEFQGIEDVLEA